MKRNSVKLILGTFFDSEPYDNYKGIRSYNPDCFTSYGTRMLVMMIAALRSHANGRRSAMTQVLLPHVLYVGQVEGIQRRTLRKLEDMSNPYVVEFGTAFAEFCNSIAPDTAVFPIEHLTAYHYVLNEQPQSLAFFAKKRLYIAVQDGPMTSEEARRYMNLGFPRNMLPSRFH
jgi:hypothetical protein